MDKNAREFLAKIKALNLHKVLAGKAFQKNPSATSAAEFSSGRQLLSATAKKSAAPPKKKLGAEASASHDGPAQKPKALKKKMAVPKTPEDAENDEDDEEGMMQGMDFGGQEEAPDVMSCAKSIVKVFVSSNSPDHGQPYQLQRAQPSIGSGWFLEFNGEPFIITNAHVVANWTSVHIKKYGSARKWKAQVLHQADTCDLAILTVPSRAFWRNATLLHLGEPPALNSPVFVCGYPTGGDELSVTSGVVSRFGVQPYAHSGDAYMSIQISAPINSGNSGGPVLQFDPMNGEFVVAGVAFEALMGANSIGYMICPSVVNHMLEQWSEDHPEGAPSLNLITSEIESDIQKKSLFVPPLAGILDYMYDLSQIQETVKAMLKDQGLDLAALLEQAGVDPESKEGKEALDGMFGDDDHAPTQAEHFIINHDKEYDYVIFRRSPDDEDDFYDDELGEIDDDGFDSDFADDDDDQEEEKEKKAAKKKDAKAERKFPAKQPSIKDLETNVHAKSKVKSPLSPKETNEDDEKTLDEHLELDDTALYRIKRTNQNETRPPPPAKLLPLLLADNGLYDTQIGVVIRNIVPHSPTRDVLKVGDVILFLDDVPVSSDETILFREAERVRYSYLTTQHQIGDKIKLVILRGFDIMTVEIEVQKKAVVAPLFFHRIPQWLVALGLLFVPLSGNLLEAEVGEEWPSGSPITLLSSLFLGVLDRFHPDEQVIVLTSVLPHPSTEGYTNALEKLTHINGERVINMKHLSEILSKAVEQYTTSKCEFDKIKAQRDAENKKSNVDDSIPPAKFFDEFTKKLEAFTKSKFIDFKTHSGEVVTLSLEDGHKNQVEILKLHQIPLPGCCSTLKPMYEMEIDMKFKNPELSKEDLGQLLSPELKKTKSLQRAGIKSPGPLSPRVSGHNLKALSALEMNPELSQAESQFPNDFDKQSPSGHLKKFAKSAKRSKESEAL